MTTPQEKPPRVRRTFQAWLHPYTEDELRDTLPAPPPAPSEPPPAPGGARG